MTAGQQRKRCAGSLTGEAATAAVAIILRVRGGARFSGADDAPYWPELALIAESEREGGRDEEYRMVCTDKDGAHSLRMTQTEWEKYKVGDNVVLTISASGTVQEIKKK